MKALGPYIGSLYQAWVETEMASEKGQRIVRQMDYDFNPDDYPFYDRMDEVQKDTSDDNPVKQGLQQQTYWTDIFVYWEDDPMVIEGSIRGFFSDLSENKTLQSLCYNSFTGAYDDFKLWRNSNASIFEPYLYIHDIQDLFDVYLESFEFYADCGFENLLIQQGVHFSSLNGLFSAGVNMYFELARIFQDEVWQKQVVKSIMYANFYQREDDWIIVGKYVGQIFRKLFISIKNTQT